jgi:very-short-patch-repair endonuclease
MSEPVYTTSLRDRLLKERSALLDLSARNRLLNTPLRTRNNRAIEIVDEMSTEVFRILGDGKSMTFLPGVALSEEERAALDPDDVETGGIPQPVDNTAVDERAVALRHSDLRLQTRLTTQGLQKRLFDIWYDARTLEEEQGVNILYLAIGLLRWFDKENSELPRHAPLVLLPVTLERSNASEKFRLKGRGDPPSPNITLQAKMKAEFNLVIDDFHDEDELDLTAYCARIAETVSKEPRWEVLPDSMVLGFFSFSKFLMYRDLDPENWPETSPIDQHPMIAALLRDGFPESLPIIPDGAAIDQAIPPLELNHVVDADSSQTVAIAEAAAGRTLVVKGPPGTGKSQTITNIIAAAAAKGRKVLFVSEKMAALDVVFRRLQRAGLGPMTLELHSNKTNKRALLEELRRTKDAVPKPARGDLSIVQRLSDSADGLNLFADRLHFPLQPSGLTPHGILARLVAVLNSNAAGGFALTGAEAWTPQAVVERRNLVEDLSERSLELGPVPRHIWRGVRRDALDPSEREELGRQIGLVNSALQDCLAVSQVPTEQLGAPEPITLNDFSVSSSYLQCAATAPPTLDWTALSHPAWMSQTGDLERLIAAGNRWRGARVAIGDGLNRAGWAANYESIRALVVTKGRSLFRIFDGNYRAQIALLRSYVTKPLPRAAAARIALIDQIIDAQEAKADFEHNATLGRAFGAAWSGENSDWNVLRAAIDWRKEHDLPATVWTCLSSVTDKGPLSEAHAGLEQSLARLNDRLGALATFLDLDLARAFAVEDLSQIPVTVLAERLKSWAGNMEAVTRFIAFASRGRELSRLGANALVEALHDGMLDHASLMPVFDRAYGEVLRNALFTAWPELRAFDGDRQNRSVKLFRELDRARIELAKEQIAAHHAEQRPKGSAGVGPLGVLNAELAKRRGHLPIRQLLDKAGPAIQQLKPVFMMSPLSVAQFLKPGGLTFDLLVMDEASQIEPVDALGAVARVGQLVVVGDEKQLPPTSFFRKLTGEDDKDDDDDGVAIQAKDAESILDLCLAKGVPFRLLNWHYRSKHQSLIAVSNKEFYENKLYIVPSPYDAVAGMGLKFHLLRETAYDRGGTRTNAKEARAVAEAVIRHARETPGQSLGVATFSVAQRQTVLKELELLRRENPNLEGFFSAGGNEPFFVKNLENIQGDERDVIFISVGYGKTAEGYLAHGFGPLSSDGGERRLNVLISRAKLRCEVFCNFTGADIDLERTRARGVAALKLFLTFAETGKFGLGDASGDPHDSEFEAQVCDRLRAQGYDVKAQIGASGFRVDLAVADPEKPGRFVLGIECDGAQYHASRSARDRDRLRQQVLEAHGWIIHRIWSADWYMRPLEELKKVEAAIAGANAEWRERDGAAVAPSRAVPVTFEDKEEGEVDILTAIVSASPAADIAPPRVLYREAEFAVNRQTEPHEAPLAEMAAYVVRIVEIEGPIHLDEIATRIRILWGLQRAGNRIRAAVSLAADVAAKRGLIAGGPIYSLPGQVIVVRDRSEVMSTTLRRPEMLPPCEVDAALLKVVDDNFGASRSELTMAASRLFGFQQLGQQLRAVLDDGISRLVVAGKLIAKDDLLVRAQQ